MDMNNLRWMSFPYLPMEDKPGKPCEASRHYGQGRPATWLEVLYNSNALSVMTIRQAWHVCLACHLDLGLLTDPYTGNVRPTPERQEP